MAIVFNNQFYDIDQTDNGCGTQYLTFEYSDPASELRVGYVSNWSYDTLYIDYKGDHTEIDSQETRTSFQEFTEGVVEGLNHNLNIDEIIERW